MSRGDEWLASSSKNGLGLVPSSLLDLPIPDSCCPQEWWSQALGLGYDGWHGRPSLAAFRCRGCRVTIIPSPSPPPSDRILPRPARAERSPYPQCHHWLWKLGLIMRMINSPKVPAKARRTRGDRAGTGTGGKPPKNARSSRTINEPVKVITTDRMSVP